MHETRPDGTLLRSTCDFCGKEWDPHGTDLMIEGHQGSLICTRCLSIAYSDVSVHRGGFEHQGTKCTMCIEERDQPQWQSPVNEANRVCLRCIKQAATALEKDEESGWKRPGA